MLAKARQALEETELRVTGGRAEREAVAILRKAMSGGEAIVLRGDTAVELDLLMGASVLCGTEPRALLLPPQPAGADPGLTSMPQLPSAEDLVMVRRFDGSADGQWWHAVVDSVTTRRDDARCSAYDGWRPSSDSAAPPLRILVADTVPLDLEMGSELRVLRRGRFALYHIGRGEWAMGWRRCHPWNGVCGSIQPVASPLRAPAASGLRVTAESGHWEVSALAVGGRGASAVLPW
jgi:hypothetical protein